MLSAAPNGSLLAAAAKPAAPPARRSSQRHVCRASSADRCSDTLQRRQALAALVAVTAAAMGSGATQPAAAASDFVQTASGLLIQGSEQRRVGKECRSRWWQYVKKKKHEGLVEDEDELNTRELRGHDD